ncbi:hypothetical protein [uncultured Apibacter sp.]|uniref:hypothetical protein n=1 Tax=uncultured Apibacter sp. TaxID=1778616 RepID=UPI0025F38D61|nr:hypothetical protein [uncultured Apibacter sp.]
MADNLLNWDSPVVTPILILLTFTSQRLPFFQSYFFIYLINTVYVLFIKQVDIVIFSLVPFPDASFK